MTAVPETAVPPVPLVPETAGPLADTPAGTGLVEIADRIRMHVVDMCAGHEGGHLGGSMSVVDILTVLYFGIMRVDPAEPGHPDRDIFVLSKGHGALALYATLAERGFLPVAELAEYGQPGSRLTGHPLPTVPGVEMPTGSLGHGLALGLGFALASRLRAAGSGPPAGARTFVVTGDGELQEGSCWEAASCAAAQRADRLVAIVDRERIAADRPDRRHLPAGTAGRPLAGLRVERARGRRARPGRTRGGARLGTLAARQAERAARRDREGARNTVHR